MLGGICLSAAIPEHYCLMITVLVEDFDIFIAEVIKTLKEILKGMTEKVDQIELDKVKEFLIKDNKQSLKNNNYWLSLMTEKLLYGFDVRTDFDKVIKSITTDDIKSFTKSVIDANNMIEVVMIPE